MPAVRKIFEKHISLNSKLITSNSIVLSPMAISNEEKEVEFSNDIAHRDGNTYIKESYVFSRATNKITVQCQSIDGLIKQGYEKPDIIKMDVEGAEYDVLVGAKNAIETYLPNILLATHDCHLPGVQEKCLSFLKELGYDLQHTGRHNKYMVGLDDYIAIHKSKLLNLKNEEKIKLLILTPTLQCGGSEKFVSLICEHINTNIFSVCLLIVNNANPFYNIKNPAVEIIDLKKNRTLFSLPAIKKAVKYFKPDIIFSTADHLNLYLAIFKNQFSSGISFIARGASIVSINSKQAKVPWLYNMLMKNYYHRFDMVICQSAYMQQDLVKNYRMPADKTSVIYNATAEVLHTPALPIKESDRVYKFITVARLSAEKGIERLIHAVAQLSVPFRYFIIGGGSKKNELQKLIDELQLNEKVFLTRQKDDPFSGMEDADLFLMGSYYEGFPNVLLEAGAHGLPVVAFNAPGGIAEIIIDKENGLLVEDNNITAFVTAITTGLAANFNRQKIKETTGKRFSVVRMLAEIQALFIKEKKENSI